MRGPWLPVEGEEVVPYRYQTSPSLPSLAYSREASEGALHGYLAGRCTSSVLGTSYSFTSIISCLCACLPRVVYGRFSFFPVRSPSCRLCYSVICSVVTSLGRYCGHFVNNQWDEEVMVVQCHRVFPGVA